LAIFGLISDIFAVIGLVDAIDTSFISGQLILLTNTSLNTANDPVLGASDNRFDYQIWLGKTLKKVAAIPLKLRLIYPPF